jgi:hypothetical protein
VKSTAKFDLVKFILFIFIFVVALKVLMIGSVFVALAVAAKFVMG